MVHSSTQWTIILDYDNTVGNFDSPESQGILNHIVNSLKFLNPPISGINTPTTDEQHTSTKSKGLKLIPSTVEDFLQEVKMIYDSNSFGT